MSDTVPAFALYALVLLPVVEKQVVQQSRTCARLSVQSEKSAKPEIVVGNVQAVLKSCCTAVMRKIPKPQNIFVPEQILHALKIIFLFR